MFKRPLFLIAASVALIASSAQAASLELTVEGLSKTEGQVLVAVYDRAELWLKGKPLKAAMAAVEGRSVTLLIEDLPEGASLALSVVHDLNGNKRLDMNAFGMPVEPYGFSNNAAGSFGPPSFEAAKIVVNGAAKAKLSLN